MIRNFALTFFLLVPTLTHAQVDSQFHFNGQNSEVLKAEKQVIVITPEQVQVPSTCYRQVPTGQIQVCRDETRYREECSWIPSREDCRTEYDRVCTPVSRSREVCSGGGSHQECSTIPSTTVCNERPTNEVCTTLPDGTPHCTTVGGGQHCQEVGGGQHCTTVYDSPNCHTEYYSDEECTSVPQNRCETIPGRNDCQSIPYSENVCGMEMQYRTESYACTETVIVNKEEKKLVKAETSIQIETNGLVDEFQALVSIKEKSSQFKEFTIDVKLLKEPKLFVILKKKEVKITSSMNKVIELKANLIFEVRTLEMLPVSLPQEITSAVFRESTKKLTLVVNGKLAAKGSVDINLSKKELFSRKTVAELKGTYPTKLIEVGAVEGKPALSIDLKAAMKANPKKSMKLKIVLEGEMDISGVILNATKPQLKKEFPGINVIMK